MEAYLEKAMREYSCNGLVNEFIEQYNFEYGEKKAAEVSNALQQSQKAADFISRYMSISFAPIPKEVELLLNSIGYFMFSKEETLCLGGLLVYSVQLTYMNELIENEEEVQMLDELFLIHVIQFISNCSLNKLNHFDNFFIRFFINISKKSK